MASETGRKPRDSTLKAMQIKCFQDRKINWTQCNRQVKKRRMRISALDNHGPSGTQTSANTPCSG